MASTSTSCIGQRLDGEAESGHSRQWAGPEIRDTNTQTNTHTNTKTNTQIQENIGQRLDGEAESGHSKQ